MRRESAMRAGSSALRTNDNIRAQGMKLLARRTRGRSLDFPIAGYQQEPERRQHGTAAILAALLSFDRSAPADAIDFIDQVPRVPVRHFHSPTRARDRTAGMNLLQQLDFAGPDVTIRVEIQTNTQ